MTVAIWILTILLIAEFVMAPINLWTGRTIPSFTRFTGFAPQVGRVGFAPVKLLAAVLMAAGLAVRPLSIAGAAITTAICVLYLLRLVSRGRRDPAGIAGFGIFGAWAVALLLLQVSRAH